MACDIVLDDDPTGVQALRDVPVVLDWSPPDLTWALAQRRPSIHLMTNVRALPAAQAERVTHAAASAALGAAPDARLILRGDSTLRGHLGEEYRAIRRATDASRPPVLLLVPALPAAQRVTLGGIHWVGTDRRRVALSETEYARDGAFAYRSARLLDWAQERSGGELAAADGTELQIEQLRAEGAPAVCRQILAAAGSGRPAACAPDAETLEDLRLIATGLKAAERAGAPVLVRCAPAFAGVLSGTLADGLVDAPRRGDRGLLIVCGSYVSATTAQLEHLRGRTGLEAIEPDVEALASTRATAEVTRVAALATAELDAHGAALVATPRERPASLTGLGAGQRIARGLADVVAALEVPPDVVIAKGGITSHVVLADGLGVHRAMVAGPVAPGVSLWRVRARAQAVAYLVFPGNVGEADHLTRIVAPILAP